MLTHWKKAFKSDYLGSSDIDEKEVLLTIERVKLTECLTASGKKMCNVAFFKEDVKPMILNVTNSKLVRELSGNKNHIEDWINISVTIYVNHSVKFGSDLVEGLRIKKRAKNFKETIDEKHPKFQDAKKALQTKSVSIEQIKAKYDISPEIEKLLVDGN